MGNFAAPSFLTKNETVGWAPSDNTRGTADIIWSSCVTIALCVWVSSYPNVPAPTDRWYHKVADKANLALIGLLGPDILMALAAGQLSSARRSIKKFNQLPGVSWSLTHGFFADMGALHIVSPDHPEGFPVNAEQLYYLVEHEFVDMPTITTQQIRDMSNFDPLSKAITLWQMLWYTITVGVRLQHGYSITTLELTTVTFAVVMLATSAMLFLKPQISTVTYLHTKGMCSMASVREFARHKTHPLLPAKWYRTPMDFASPRCFVMDKHWAYYADLSSRAKLPLFHRATKPQWDRIPSDVWYRVEGYLIPTALAVQLPFCIAFLAAWNFYFPSSTERLLWRAASVFHALYSTLGTAYYLYTLFAGKDTKYTTRAITSSPSATPIDPSAGPLPATKRFLARLQRWAESMRNLSIHQEPDMAMSLRWTISIFFPTVIYIFCRLYFYVEDFACLRSQPGDVYAPIPSLLQIFSIG
ncbi:hypothetical protein V2A60_008226 [Cordyceps javanica]